MYGNAQRFLVGGLRMIEHARNLKVIVYDEDEMNCFGGYLLECIQEHSESDVVAIEDSNHRVIKEMSNTTAEMNVVLQHEIIELDPKTMKRISEYNLQKENEGLLEEIEQHKRKIENLKTTYKELKTRIQAISDIGTDIWENGTEYKRKHDDEDYWD